MTRALTQTDSALLGQIANSRRGDREAARLAGERKQIERMAAGLAQRVFTLAWLTVPPIGFVELSRLVSRQPRQ